MLKKTGESSVISLRPVDSNGNPVSGDTPYVTIQNRSTKKYYNGLTWQDTEYRFLMNYIANGMYTSEFILNDVGSFDVIATSTLIPTCTKSIVIDTYSEQSSSVLWVKGESFNINYGTAAATSATVSIKQEYTGLYLQSDNSWSANKAELAMLVVTDNVFSFIFTPDVATQCLICCNAENEDSLIYVLDIRESNDDITPITVNNKTVVSLDGSDSTLVEDRTNEGIEGVMVSAYNSITKNKVNTAYSNSDGTWSMLLRPGMYIFTFTKDGYDDVSFERQVS